MINNFQWETISWKITLEEKQEAFELAKILRENEGRKTERFSGDYMEAGTLGELTVMRNYFKKLELPYEWNKPTKGQFGDKMDFKFNGCSIDLKTQKVKRQYDTTDNVMVKTVSAPKPMDYYLFGIWNWINDTYTLIGFKSQEEYMCHPEMRMVMRGESLKRFIGSDRIWRDVVSKTDNYVLMIQHLEQIGELINIKGRERNY